LALVKHDVAPGIDAACNEGGRDLAGCARQLNRVLPDRDRMQIDDAVDAIVAILQLNEFDNGAEVIAEMQITGRLYPGKYPFLEGHKLSSCSPCCVPRRPMGGKGGDGTNGSRQAARVAARRSAREALRDKQRGRAAQTSRGS